MVICAVHYGLRLKEQDKGQQSQKCPKQVWMYLLFASEETYFGFKVHIALSQACVAGRHYFPTYVRLLVWALPALTVSEGWPP